MPIALSDHHMIYGVRVGKWRCGPCGTRNVRCFSQCDQEKLVEDLLNAPWGWVNDCVSIDGKWECWKKIIFDVLDNHVPFRKVRPRAFTLPWIDADIHKLMRARSYHLSKAQRSKKIGRSIRL